MNLYKIDFKVEGQKHSCFVIAKHLIDAINKAEDISLEYPYSITRIDWEDM